MVISKLYKYINILIRVLIAAIAIWIIYNKVKDELTDKLADISWGKVNFTYILLVFILMFCNWGLEALKWKKGIIKTINISFFKSLKITFTGVTVGLLTPNRIGEVPVRAMLLNKKNYGELVLKTIVTSFSQVVITILLGGLAILFVQPYFIDNDSILLIRSLAILIGLVTLVFYFKIKVLKKAFDRIPYFKKHKISEALSQFTTSELAILLLFSMLRYFVFSIQFYLIFYAFGLYFDIFTNLLLIPVCFMFTSIIPTIFFSEILVRSSIALVIFGGLFNNDLLIVASSLILWFINIALPAVFGMFGLKELKIIKNK